MTFSNLSCFVLTHLLLSVPCADADWRMLGLDSRYLPASVLSGCSFDSDECMRSLAGRQAGRDVFGVP